MDSGVGVGAERRQLKSGIIHSAAEPGGEAVGQPGEALDALEPDHFEARAEVRSPAMRMRSQKLCCRAWKYGVKL